MDSYEKIPDMKIAPVGVLSKKFLELGVQSFKEACNYVHNTDYGYNTDYDDKMIFFKENMGTCTTKHAVIAGLAAELGIPLYKEIGIYKFTEKISTGADEILRRYSLPYIPMVHCFLIYKDYRFDLTEDNCNGKNTHIDEFIHTENVDPFITQKDEYLLYKRILKQKVLQSKEMQRINEKQILKARGEAIQLLKKNTELQKKQRLS